jgi:hypothetical protein
MLSMPPEITMFADGGGAGGVRQFRAARGLTGRGLTLSGRKYAAHQNFVDLFGRQFRPFQRRADGVRAEIMSAE